MVKSITLTPQYSTDVSGHLKLYIYEANGYHRGGIYFSQQPTYEGEITTTQAQACVEEAMKRMVEIRITNSGDLLVFQANEGVVLYPNNPQDFWQKAGQPK